jgi:hypothetical protein
MDMYHSERHIGDDGDSLTEMNESGQAESFSHDDTRCQRNVSYIIKVLTKELTCNKQFWDLRYQVQKIQHPFHDRAQEDFSFRLTALNHVARFNAKAIHETRVRRAVKDLLRRSFTLRHDRRRLRKRSQHLLKRLSGTIYAYQRWRGYNI